MMGFLNPFRLKTWLVLGALAGLLYLAYLFVPAVREGVDSIRYSYMMAVPSMAPLKGSNSTEIIRFNMAREDQPPHYLYVQDAYLDRRVFKGGVNYAQSGMSPALKLIVTYPGFRPVVFKSPDDKYSISLSLSYRERGRREPRGFYDPLGFYEDNYDLIIRDPDERVGEYLYGFMAGSQKPVIKLTIGRLRIGSDKWFYLDKATNTYARLTCQEGRELVGYWSCVASMVLDENYMLLFSLPGKELNNFEQFVVGVRSFVHSLEVAP